jgi:hypothetical protein
MGVIACERKNEGATEVTPSLCGASLWPFAGNALALFQAIFI